MALLDDFQPEEYERYKVQGIEDKYIAEKILMVSLSVLNVWKRKHKIKRNIKRKLNFEEVRRLYDNGMSVHDLKEKYKCGKSSIYWALKVTKNV